MFRFCLRHVMYDSISGAMLMGWVHCAGIGSLTHIIGLQCSHLLVLLHSKIDFQHSPLPCNPRGASVPIRLVKA